LRGALVGGLSRLPLSTFRSSFEERLEAHELMDEPGADPVLLRRTMDQFRGINERISMAARRFSSLFFPMMERGREYRLIDVGSGGCDIPMDIVRRARRRGLRLSVLALDRDERMVGWAREATADYPEIEVRRADAGELESFGPSDFVISNHLLHHLSRREIGKLLSAADRCARLGFILDDLLRSPWSWLGYSVYAGLFARDSFALYDGRLSIRRGFRRAELEAILAEARLGAEARPGAEVEVFEALPGRIGFLRRVRGMPSLAFPPQAANTRAHAPTPFPGPP